ncbi:hypothetical protein [Cellvibrio polysaccharolyticus]|uniref:hypothetical protein n=1 Tax=Cellvibrio polysaccharolyticus TaxID=2082724 RepID=UPI00188235E4|nr:hypothetical protein [Cellvibrio polysaccharolyticus]
MTKTTIMKTLRQKIEKKLRPRPGYLVKLVEYHQEKFCEVNGLSYRHPGKIAHDAIIRNCPNCAKEGYHSAIFEWRWLANCPIHRMPLSDTCPACLKPWPNMIELARRNCKVCGAINLSLKDQPSHTHEYSLLHFLSMMERFYMRRLQVRLFSLHHHSSNEKYDQLKISDYWFASAFTTLYPQTSCKLDSLSTPLQPMVSRCFSDRASPDEEKILGDPVRLEK